MEEITRALGTSLRDWRRINKKSQMDVAQQISISQNQVSRFERGITISEDATFRLSKFVQSVCLKQDENKNYVVKIVDSSKQQKIEAYKPSTRYERILEWLYLHDLDASNKSSFITFLKEIL